MLAKNLLKKIDHDNYCGYCESTLTRRRWHSGTKYSKTIWQCVTSTKKGKRFCSDSKGIPEGAIEKAFLESYRIMCNNNKDVLEEFLQRMEETLSSNTIHNEIAKMEKEIQGLENKKNKLVDMRLEDIIDKETYEDKYNLLMQEINEKVQIREKSLLNLEEEKDIKKRLLAFKKVLEQNEMIDTFDRYVFESVVDKVN